MSLTFGRNMLESIDKLVRTSKGIGWPHSGEGIRRVKYLVSGTKMIKALLISNGKFSAGNHLAKY